MVLRIRLCGRVGIQVDGVDLPDAAFPGRQGRLAFAFLTIHRHRSVPRDELAGALWPDALPASWTTSLNALVSKLRRLLSVAGLDGASALPTAFGCYRLCLPEDTWVDVEAALAGDPATTCEIASKPFLPGLEGPWVDAQRAILSDALVRSLLHEAQSLLDEGRDAVEPARAATERDPFNEGAWRLLIRAHAAIGNRGEALRAWEQCRSLLAEELGSDPAPETEAVYLDVLRNEAPASALPTGVVTFLLTDIVGSTELWESHPHSMAPALARHDALIDEIASTHCGATLKSKGEGDATLSVFRRASEAAFAALELTHRLADESWPDGTELPVRIALHTGEAHERGGDYYGPAVNRAARLRSIASGGQVVVSQATAELIQDHLPPGGTLIDIGRRSLRGLSRDEQVFELCAASDASTDVPAGPVDLKLPVPLDVPAGRPFVGRDDELAQLNAVWEDVTSGSRRCVLIAGEPGIGKTRLTAELARRVHETSGLVLFGRCDEDLGVPYQPFIEAMHAYTVAAPLARLRVETGAAAADLARVFPAIGDRIPGARAGAMNEAEADRLRLFDAVASFLAAISRTQPVLLVLDDLHWAAKPTLFLLRHLARSTEPMRLMVLGTYRDTDLDRMHPLAEALADFRRDPKLMGRIGLSGLDAEAVAAYVSAAAGQVLDSEALGLAQALHESTEGNPFFMEEVLRHLVETGAVYRQNGRWTTRHALAHLGLPEGVREVLSRRLSRLPEVVNRALGVASVIGPTFSLRVLETVVGPEREDELIDALDQALGAGIVRDAGDGSFAFSHSLIRQTLYGELTSARRTRLHRRVGEAIESLPDAASHAAALAYHFAESALDGQMAKAVDYAIEASRRAIDGLAPEEAVSILTRGLETLELEREPDRARRGELLLALSIATHGSGDLDRAKNLLWRAVEDARAVGSVDLLARAAGVNMPWSHNFGAPDPATVELCEEALKVLGESRPVLRGALLAGLALYRTWNDGNTREGQLIAGQALALTRSHRNLRMLGYTLAVRALTLLGEPDVHELTSLAGELIELHTRTSDSRCLLQGLQLRAVARLRSGDRAGFEDDVAAIESRRERFSFVGVARASFPPMRALLDGRFTEVEGLANSMLEEGRFDANSWAAYAAVMIELHEELGHTDSAIAIMDRMAESNPATAPNLAAAKAGILGRAGRLDEARELLEPFGRDGLAALPHDVVRIAGLNWLTEACWVLGARAIAAELYDELVGYEGTIIVLGRIIPLSSADRLLGLLATVLGRLEEAESRFEAALDIEHRVEAPPYVARSKVHFADMLLKRNGAGDRERARELLVSAQGAAEQMGMALVAQNARTLLRF